MAVVRHRQGWLMTNPPDSGDTGRSDWSAPGGDWGAPGGSGYSPTPDPGARPAHPPGDSAQGGPAGPGQYSQPGQYGQQPGQQQPGHYGQQPGQYQPGQYGTPPPESNFIQAQPGII